MEKTGGANQKLILAAMILAVSMTFIDQTIVAIAIPQLQGDLSLSSTGVQWIINGYLLSLSALFAFGGWFAATGGTRCASPRSSGWSASSRARRSASR